MAEALAVFSSTWNGIPLLYSGQELPNKKRIKFFDKDPIKWTGDNKLGTFYKTLLNLHSSNPALRSGDPSVQTFRIKNTEPKNIFSFLRSRGDKEVFVILNMSANKTSFEITDSTVKGNFREIFKNSAADLSASNKFVLEP